MKKIIQIFSIIFTFFLFHCTRLQKETPTPVNSDFMKIDNLLKDKLQSAYKGKVYTEVQQNGKVIYKKSVGGFDENSSTFIASCTKTYSAVVILALVDDGLIKLDDPISKYLPIFKTYNNGDCTIRQCFSHTSGFPGSEEEDLLSSKTMTLEESVNKIAKDIKLQFKPGTNFAYGGLSMHIVGRVAEVASGKLWNQLFKEKVVDKLGLKGSSFYNDKNPRISGGMLSTPSDLMKLANMILNKGLFEGKRVLSESSVEELFKDQTNNANLFYTPLPNNLPYNNPYKVKEVRYGIGCWLDVQNPQTKYVEQISGDGAFGTSFWIDRCRGITGVTFTFSTFVEASSTNWQIMDEVRTKVGGGCR